MPVFRLSNELVFPPPHLAEPDGLLAVGGDLSPERLLLAYEKGIFPWYSTGDPILWWSPSPRLILVPQEFRVNRRLGRFMRQEPFKITFDKDFSQVIAACAEPRHGGPGTWITPEMQAAYTRLHEMGYAHSVECWGDNDKLEGGLYGISLGGIFFGESMFSRATNSSKVALAALVEQLTEWEFDIIDCQMKTPHLMRFGAREIPGFDFLMQLKKSLEKPTRRGAWQAALI